MKTNPTVMFNIGGWPKGRSMLGEITKEKDALGFYTVKATDKWGGGEWLVREYEMQIVAEVAA